MTLFWHSHFAASNAKVKSGQLMAHHVQMLRAHALGKYRPLLEAASRDPAMFLGRTHEMNEIAAFLRGNQSISIVGPRKVGKTSLLFHLMRPTTWAAPPACSRVRTTAVVREPAPVAAPLRPAAAVLPSRLCRPGRPHVGRPGTGSGQRGCVRRQHLHLLGPHGSVFRSDAGGCHRLGVSQPVPGNCSQPGR